MKKTIVACFALSLFAIAAHENLTVNRVIQI